MNLSRQGTEREKILTSSCHFWRPGSQRPRCLRSLLFLLLPESLFFNGNEKNLDKPSILLCLSMWITPEFSILTTVFMCLRINSSSTTWVKQTDLQHCTTFLTKLIIISLQVNSLEVSGLTDYFLFLFCEILTKIVRWLTGLTYGLCIH